MRGKALLVVAGLAAIASAFLIGRTTGAESAPTQANGTFTGRLGDVFHVPAVSMRCLVTQEAGAPRVTCSHTPRARYSVEFFRDALFVYRNGEPDKPVFASQGGP